MNPNQHGFRSGRSCLSQLLRHHDQVTRKLEEGKNVDVIYLDFAKAFDKLDYRVTLQKLHDMGITGNLLQWINSFLSNRFQCVYVQGEKSSPVQVKSGVPQGSVVGPLLFLIMLQDIDSETNFATISSFADDTRVLAGITSMEDVAALQADLDKIYQWSNNNNATFNSEKFECLRYGYDKTLINDSYYSSNTQSKIECKPFVRDLGVTICADGGFEKHISNVATSANQKCAWILRTFRTRDRFPLLILWKSLVRPILDYCSQLWCPTAPGQINTIEKVQVNYFKKIIGMQDLDYWEQLKDLKVTSLQRRRERYVCINM